MVALHPAALIIAQGGQRIASAPGRSDIAKLSATLESCMMSALVHVPGEAFPKGKAVRAGVSGI